MSAFIAVEIATKDTVNQKVPSAHLFVDVESSKVDYQNSQPEMKMEENPSSIDVNKIAEETAEGGDLAGEEWTCPWCYRENPGDVLRCPACDRFKISDAASKGKYGGVINYVKSRLGDNPETPSTRARKSIKRKGKKGRKAFRETLKNYRIIAKKETQERLAQLAELSPDSPRKNGKVQNWKDAISYGPMRANCRSEPCMICTRRQDKQLSRCEEDHKVCNQCKELVEPGECPMCVEEAMAGAKFESGRRFITDMRWETFATVYAVLILFLEDCELLMYSMTFQDMPYFDEPVFWVFLLLKIFSFGFFMFDLIMRSIVMPTGQGAYVLSLTWWLDLISTLCLLPYEDMTKLITTGGSAELGVLTASLKVLNLIKLMRVLRAIRVLRLLKKISVKKDKDGKASKKAEAAHDSNANEMHAELTRVLTTKVIVFILVLYAGFPVLKLLLGDICTNSHKMQSLGTDSLEQLNIAMSSTGLMGNMKTPEECTSDEFCNNAINTFKHSVNLYLDSFVTNVTLAGVPWPSIGQPDVYNESWVRTGKGFYRHVCVVHSGVDQWICNSDCYAAPAGRCCSENSCGVCDNCFGGEVDPGSPLAYFFTIDLTSSARTDATYSILATIFLMILLLGTVAVLYREVSYISTGVAKPVVALAKDMNDVGKLVFNGDNAEIFEALAKQSKVYEVSMMKQSFLRMKHAIKAFSKFVPREVVRNLVITGTDARLSADERPLVVFFSDIASFTSICEALQADQLYLLLSSYFEEMSRIIDDTNGTLIEYIGDAILAIWNAPLQPERHPSCLGMCASLLMQEKLREMRIMWGETIFKLIENLPPLRVRCGLHMADTFVGNIGSPVRMKFGVVGETVHVAGALEELNKTYTTEILVSEAMAETRAVRDRMVVRKIDFFVEHDVQEWVFEPLTVHNGDALSMAACERANAITRCHDDAFDMYTQRQFADAAKLFEEAERLCISSRQYNPTPAQMLKDRCNKYVENPPDDNWNFT